MTTATVASPSTGSFGTMTRAMSSAENRKVSASSQNAHSMGIVDAMNPDAANPTAVDPNELIDIIELAAASSSSGATSGSTASLAGSKKVETALATATRR